jgi:hypothetical protein
MPFTTGIHNPTVFIPGGPANVDTYNEPTLRRAGDLGSTFTIDGVTRMIVKHDSGATAAAPTGVVTAGELAYFKDRLNAVVTNDLRFSEESHNSVAGIYRNAVTAGNFTAIVVKGRNISVKAAGATWNVNDTAESNQSSNAADVQRTAAGTANGNMKVGTVRGPLASGLVPLDVDLPWVP